MYSKSSRYRSKTVCAALRPCPLSVYERYRDICSWGRLMCRTALTTTRCSFCCGISTACTGPRCSPAATSVCAYFTPPHTQAPPPSPWPSASAPTRCTCLTLRWQDNECDFRRRRRRRLRPSRAWQGQHCLCVMAAAAAAAFGHRHPSSEAWRQAMWRGGRGRMRWRRSPRTAVSARCRLNSGV